MNIEKTTKTKFIYIDSVQIVKNSMLWGFLELGYEVIRPDIKVDLHSYSEETVLALIEEIKKGDVAVTRNFVPAVAEACRRVNVPYISWVYDSPQVALFTKEAEYETNHIFMFDRGGMDYVLGCHKMNIYHLPLAANITEASIVDISDEDIEKFACQISFVGSLYNKEYLCQNRVSPDVLSELKSRIRINIGEYSDVKNYYSLFDDEIYGKYSNLINMKGTEGTGITERFLMDQLYGMPLIAHEEREMYINRAAEKYDTRFYTGEVDVQNIKAKICPPVRPEDEMYKVFYSSKINLNITHRGILTGIPQRVFDIMAVGGFVLSNYQSEIEEFFNIGEEIEVFHDMKEFDEKLDYYLNHEKERIRVGINGYLKVNELYNYRLATEIMIEKTLG